MIIFAAIPRNESIFPIRWQRFAFALDLFLWQFYIFVDFHNNTFRYLRLANRPERHKIPNTFAVDCGRCKTHTHAKQPLPQPPPLKPSPPPLVRIKTCVPNRLAVEMNIKIEKAKIECVERAMRVCVVVDAYFFRYAWNLTQNRNCLTIVFTLSHTHAIRTKWKHSGFDVRARKKIRMNCVRSGVSLPYELSMKMANIHNTQHNTARSATHKQL